MDKNYFLVFALAALVLLSGCVSEELNVINVVKKLPEVNAFLAEHPNAEIKAIYLSKENATAQIADIREECGSQMKEQSYWFVEIKEGDAKVSIWLDGETKKALCIIKKGKDECQSNAECDDQDPCTIDRCAGKPKKCSNEKITKCKKGDDCCPAGCTAENDSDCKVPVQCVDTDAGENLDEKGKTLNTEFKCEDSCQQPDGKGYVLFECVCDPSAAKGAVAKPYVCPRGTCVGGICTDEPIERTCTAECKKDGVRDEFSKGYLILTNQNCGQQIIYDECKDSEVLYERKCTSGDNFASEEIRCAYGCEDGVCSTDSGVEPSKCGCADITFDGKIDVFDLSFVGQKVGTKEALADIDMDGDVTEKDLNCISLSYNQQTNCAGPKKLEEYSCEEADLIKSGKVDVFELTLMGLQIGKKQGDSDFNATADITKDGWVNNIDFAIIAAHYGETCFECGNDECETGETKESCRNDCLSCGCPDVTFDGKVDIFDLSSLGIKYGTSDPLTDIDMDLNVTEFDLNCVRALYNNGTSCAGPKPLEEYSCAEADMTADGKVDISDLALIGRTIRSRQGQANYDARADITKDNWVNNIDFAIMRSHYGETC